MGEYPTAVPLSEITVPQPEMALAESLSATVRDLQAYIEVRADEIAGPLITATRQRAEEELGAVRAAAARERQRNEDLIAELRRQLDAAVKSRDREFDELKRLRATVFRVKQVRHWKNEDGRWFAFRDDLYAALDGEVDPT
jgi:hypothetical protein